ncbi:monofunctional biosynthetic peptidoglycan transglycosylase [Marinimicrococcus flavescens]|uniref:Biosynthetic peptidoglycan transglycosylase n=1 Tax=Marinimicrococcus flavescens TaxID=3031815 RepID=A0AAP3UXJ2_9PROT|nr:monofunctional biosynthetic peptidoglycan transglycosylase [Marinimicrococcus flavescens]
MARSRDVKSRWVSAGEARLRRARRWLVRLAVLALIAPFVLIALFSVVPVPITPLMVIRMVQGHGLDKQWVPLEDIAPELRFAVIAAEDNVFCEHGGFDWKALRGQFEVALDGGRPRGASTITMQAAKNLLLWPGRDLLRKAAEAWLTPQLELLWSKRRVMEVYLNIVEFGPGIYGAESAARHFFRKPASELGRREAAALAAVLPNPLRWSPRSGSAFVKSRTDTIARRIDQLGPLLDCVR